MQKNKLLSVRIRSSSSFRRRSEPDHSFTACTYYARLFLNSYLTQTKPSSKKWTATLLELPRMHSPVSSASQPNHDAFAAALHTRGRHACDGHATHSVDDSYLWLRGCCWHPLLLWWSVCSACPRKPCSVVEWGRRVCGGLSSTRGVARYGRTAGCVLCALWAVSAAVLGGGYPVGVSISSSLVSATRRSPGVAPRSYCARTRVCWCRRIFTYIHT